MNDVTITIEYWYIGAAMSIAGIALAAISFVRLLHGINRRIQRNQCHKIVRPNSTKPVKRELDEGCTCHICPPCGYCVSHSNCVICDSFVLNDDLVEFNDDWICEECLFEKSVYNDVCPKSTKA